MLSLKLAWRNLFRNARRTLLTVMLIGFSLTAMIIADGGLVGMTRMMIDTVTETVLGDVQIHHPGYLDSFEPELMLHDGDELLQRVRSLDSVAAAAPRVMAGGMVSSAYNLAGAQIYGINSVLERDVSKIDDAVVDGSYLTGAPGEVLIGIELMDQLDVELGDRLVLTLAEAESGELAQALFRVSGVLEFGMVEFDRSALVVNIAQLQSVMAMDNRFHQIVVQLVDRDQAENPDAEIFTLRSDEVDAISWLEASPEISAILGMTTYSSLIVGMILFVLASLGVINSMFMSIFERIYEIGVIRAVGTKPGQIVGFVVMEAMMIAVLSCALGGALGAALGYYFSNEGIPMGEIELSGINMSHMKTVLLPRHFIEFPFFVIVLTMLASLYPARFASKIVPAHALKKTL